MTILSTLTQSHTSKSQNVARSTYNFPITDAGAMPKWCRPIAQWSLPQTLLSTPVSLLPLPQRLPILPDRHLNRPHRRPQQLLHHFCPTPNTFEIIPHLPARLLIPLFDLPLHPLHLLRSLRLGVLSNRVDAVHGSVEGLNEVEYGVSAGGRAGEEGGPEVGEEFGGGGVGEGEAVVDLGGEGRGAGDRGGGGGGLVLLEGDRGEDLGCCG